ncbi:MAG TPA: hypothetical protein VM123_17605 [archaeon]|nr:hypothetical protein [archaeon]
MLQKRITAGAGLIFLAGFIAACGPSLDSVSFQPGPLSPVRLVDAAARAGFRVRELDFDCPRPVPPRLPFNALDYDDSLLVTLRGRYGLKEVVAGAEDEWQGQLLLKHWVHSRIKNGTPKVEANNAVEILEYAAQGKEFWCSYFAITYMQCAQALGWQARKLGLDRYHGAEGLGSKHHGAVEVWSNRFRKWVYIDPQSDLHFERNGVPLSAWEIRSSWLKSRGQGVDHVTGVPPDTVLKNPAVIWWDLPDEDETALFFWLYYADNAADWNEEGAARFIFPQDSANAGLTWYQNDYKNNKSRRHTGYQKGLFLPTDSLEDVYWTVGVVEANLVEAAPGEISLSLRSWCPNLRGYEISCSSEVWQPVADSSRVVWPLKKGSNYLALRTVNKAGVTGPETSLRVLLE